MYVAIANWPGMASQSAFKKCLLSINIVNTQIHIVDI